MIKYLNLKKYLLKHFYLSLVPVITSNYTYTVEIDRTDIQLLCQIESYSLQSFRWKIFNSTILYLNPLNISNELLSLGNSQESCSVLIQILET